MDGERFDQMVKALTNTAPRRRVVGSLVGGLAAAFAATGATASPCRPPNTRCGRGRTASCVNLQDDRRNCGACGTVCTAGVEQCCRGACEPYPDSCTYSIAYQTTGIDSFGTGNDYCLTACYCKPPSDPSCSSGCGIRSEGNECVCAPDLVTCPCPESEPGCSPGDVIFCRDLQTDDYNCGTCLNRCPAGTHCVNGSCTS